MYVTADIQPRTTMEPGLTVLESGVGGMRWVVIFDTAAPFGIYRYMKRILLYVVSSVVHVHQQK